MAVRETQFQRELVSAAEDCEFHAFKASHREKTGVLDLYVRAAGAAIWIECKWMTVQENFRTEKVSMTRPQWAFARNELDAGGVVGTIIGYRRLSKGHDVHGLLICNPRDQDTQVMRSWLDDREHPGHIEKERGKDWPAMEITRRIMAMQAGLMPWADQDRD